MTHERRDHLVTWLFWVSLLVAVWSSSMLLSTDAERRAFYALHPNRGSP